MVAEPSAASAGLLSKSLKTASSLMILQLVSRLVTFVLNQSLVRLASPAVFGTASIQFELLLSTILFLSREGVRNALLRAESRGSGSGQELPQSIVNISILPTLLGVPVALLSTSAYLYTTSLATKSQPYFTTAVILYATSSIFELLSEPLYIRAQNDLQFNVRVKAEGTGVVVKAAITVAVILLGGEDKALLGFAIGQMSHGIIVLSTFARAYPGKLTIWPSRITETVHENTRSYYYDPELLRLSFAMTTQSVIKHLLTEGDRLIVSRISSLEDQGGYAVASNYGSLVARIVFQPIEETSRLMFSKTLAKETSSSSEDTPDEKHTPQDPDSTPEPVKNAFTVLSLLLLLHMHLALLLVTFVPPYLSIVLAVLLPGRYHQTSALRILALYPLLLPAMAFNGTLEAFFASTSTPRSLRAHSTFLVTLSVACASLVWVLVEQYQLTKTGLVWANMANLIGRALWSAWWARSWFGQRGRGWTWTNTMPPLSVWGSFAASAAITRANIPPSAGRLGLGSIGKGELIHIGTGIVCVLVTLGVCYISERRTIQRSVQLLRNR